MLKKCNHIWLILLLLMSAALTHAEVVRLKSGEQVQGSIVFENEEVIVIKKTDGSRFQYLKQEVEAVLPDEAFQAPKEEQTKAKTQNPVTALLQLSGAVNFPLSDIMISPGVAVDLFLLSRPLPLNRDNGDDGAHCAIGGGIGYQLAGSHFLPIQLRTDFYIPCATAWKAHRIKRAREAVIGLGIGYGVGLYPDHKGGLRADLSAGWRWFVGNNGKALAFTFFANCQQAHISNQIVTNHGEAFFEPLAVRTFTNVGVRFGVYL